VTRERRPKRHRNMQLIALTIQMECRQKAISSSHQTNLLMPQYGSLQQDSGESSRTSLKELARILPGFPKPVTASKYILWAPHPREESVPIDPEMFDGTFHALLLKLIGVTRKVEGKACSCLWPYGSLSISHWTWMKCCIGHYIFKAAPVHN
jgi:hypothetical protein